MTTASSPAPTITTGARVPTSTRPSVRTTSAGAVLGGALATTGALAVFAIGSVGAPVRVITGWAPNGADLTLAEVVVTTIVSVAIAAVGLLILDRLMTNGLRAWTVAVAVVTVLSCLPLWGLDIDTGSKVALTAMHLVVGGAVIAGQAIARRTRP
jgi:hypothetical protein